VVITFNIDTKEFTEYTDSEWEEEIAFWQEELWEKYEDGVFNFENSEIVQIYNQGKVYTYEFDK
tara:strand:- start:426 stop:617 length:192 start_codon:yes stop_codon:yes gene_type:complete